MLPPGKLTTGSQALVKSDQYELLYTVKTNLENLLNNLRFILIL